MSAPPPPTDREALVSQARLNASTLPGHIVDRLGERLRYLPDQADQTLYSQLASAIEAQAATIADLRSKLAATEGENERLWQDGETAKTELSRLVVGLRR